MNIHTPALKKTPKGMSDAEWHARVDLARRVNRGLHRHPVELFEHLLFELVSPL